MISHVVPIEQKLMICFTSIVISPREINHCGPVVRIGGDDDEEVENVVAATDDIKIPGAPSFRNSVRVQIRPEQVTKRHE